MKRYILITAVLSLIISLVGSGAEPTTPPATTPEPVKESRPVGEVKITQEWTDTPLREILHYIAEKTGVTIIPDLSVDDEARVDYLPANNLDWRDVLNEAVRLSRCVVEEVKPNYFQVTKPDLISMSFPENTPVEKVIAQIAKAANVSIIIANDVQGVIKCSFTDVPWMYALEYVCKTSGFAVVKESYKVYRIIKSSALAEQLETRVFQLRFLRPPTDYRAKIDVSTYAIGSAKAPDPSKDFTVLEILQNMLSKGGSLKYDGRTNSIIVKDTKPVLDEMERVITKLDTEPMQIMFMVYFINTANEDLLKFGIDYTTATEAQTGGGWSINTIPSAFRPSPYSADTTPTTPNILTQDKKRLTSSPFGMGRDVRPEPSKAPYYTAGFLTEFDLTATLRMFARDAQSRLEQRPFILTLDGKEATIWVGEKVHYAQVTVSQATGSTTSQTSITEAANSPAEQGFQLLVIPNIIRDTNKIQLTIIPQNKTLTGSRATPPEGFETFTVTSDGQNNSIDLPRIQESTLVTNLIAEDGQTAVIGGLSTERNSKSITKLPLLGDIPLIGEFLFRYTYDSVKKTHLLIYLTPRIISPGVKTEEALKSLEQANKKAGEVPPGSGK